MKQITIDWETYNSERECERHIARRTLISLVLDAVDDKTERNSHCFFDKTTEEMWNRLMKKFEEMDGSQKI